jgi:hypothetical protein
MAKVVKDAVAEKIELLEQLDETSRHKGHYFWWVGSAVLALVATTGGFFVLRRLLKPTEK